MVEGWWRIAVLSMVALAACAPRLQPPGTEPQAARLVDDHVVAPDGRRLPLAVWRTKGSPRAVLVALHGFNDYRLAFSTPAVWWAGQGITIYAYDQRGFGATAHRGIWAGTDAMVADLATVIDLVAARHPGVPLWLLGDSMGGAVVMAAMARRVPPEVAGAVLVAPAVWGRATMNPIYRAALWFAVHVMPANRSTGQGLGIRASDNIEMLRALGRDAMVIKWTRNDAVYGLVGLMDAAYAAAPELELPLLVLYGARDELIPRAPVEQMLARLAAPHRVAVYPDGWHMLLRDLQAEVVWRDVAAYVLDPTAAQPSGLERAGLPVFATR